MALIAHSLSEIGSPPPVLSPPPSLFLTPDSSLLLLLLLDIEHPFKSVDGHLSPRMTEESLAPATPSGTSFAADAASRRGNYGGGQGLGMERGGRRGA